MDDALKGLQTIPGSGPRTAADLLGVRSVAACAAVTRMSSTGGWKSRPAATSTAWCSSLNQGGFPAPGASGIVCLPSVGD